MGVWIKLRGRKHGPFDDSQLQTMVRQGKIGRHNEISHDGINWEPASNYVPLYSLMSGNDSRRHQSTNGQTNEDLSFSSESPFNDSKSNSSKEWFVSEDGITGKGPYAENEVLESIRLGKMSLSWLAWKEGGEPKPLNDYSEFRNNASDEIIPAKLAEPSASSSFEKIVCSACQYPLSPETTFCPRCGKKYKKSTAPKEKSAYSLKETKGNKKVACRFCGKEISPKLLLCPYCHSILDESQRKSRLTYLLLGLLVLGWFGAHNFYAKRKDVAVKQLLLGLTIVGLVFTIIWAIIDVLTVHMDGRGLPFVEIE